LFGKEHARQEVRRVPRLTTLDWTLRYGWLSWSAPELTVIVE